MDSNLWPASSVKAILIPFHFARGFLCGMLSAAAVVSTGAELPPGKADDNTFRVPRTGSGTYSREDRLRRLEDERARIESNSALTANEKCQTIEEIMAQADGNHLAHLKWADGGRLDELVYPFAVEMETKWQNATKVGYVQALSTVAVGLLDRFSVSAQEMEMARRLVEGSVERLADVPTRVAVGALYRFSVSQGRNETPIIPMDWIPREQALAEYLRVLTDVREFLKTPEDSVFVGLTEAEKRYFLSGHTPTSTGGVLNTPADDETYRKRREFLADRKFYDDKPGSDPKYELRYGNELRLQGALTNHLQRHFTMAPADLDIIQLALDKYVKDPGLKERIVLAAYKGTNPFIGRTPAAKSAAVAVVQPDAPTPKTESSKGALAKGVTKTFSPTMAPEPPTGVGSGPLATTPAVSGRNSGLWAAFAGAGALILFVLWRAQARGNPGRGK